MRQAWRACVQCQPRFVLRRGRGAALSALAAALSALAVVSVAAGARAEEEKRSKGAMLLVGPQVYQHQYASGGKPASTETIADVLQFSEQLGVQYNLTDKVQAQMAVQSTEALTRPGPDQPSRWTDLSLQPGVSYQLLKILDVGLSPVLALRTGGEGKVAFALQPQVGTKKELGAGFTFRAQLQAPVYLTPELTVQLEPLVGLGYTL